MNILTLKVDGSLPGDISFEIQRPAGNQISAIKTKLTVEEINEVPSLLSQLLPPNLIGELSQWVLNNSSPGLLSVISNSLLEGIPWECLPQILEMRNVLLVRQFIQSEPLPDEPAHNEVRVLAAGWSGKPTFNLPGIQMELAAISQLGTSMGFQAKVLFEQNLTTVAKACTTFHPNILHLIPASINNEGKEPELIFSGEKQIEYIPIKKFLESLPADLRPLLAILNTCHGGKGGKSPSALHLIAEHLHTVAIGWLGEINDRTAVDFARFIYARFIEGKTIIDALRAYLSIRLSYGNKEVGTRNDYPMSLPGEMQNEVPVVWTPSIELLTRPLIELSFIKEVPVQKPKKLMAPITRSAEKMHVKAEPVIRHEPSLPTLTIDFSPQKWLNPALLKNGRPAVNNLRIISDTAVRNVGIAVSCDAGNGNSIVRQTFNLEKGPQPIPIDTWQFPVLYQLMRTAVPRRQINFTVSCTLAGQLLAETTKSVLWMGRTEWLDMPDTWHFLPAFVDPYSEGILDVIGNADNVLKTISGPTSSFVGYDSPNDVTEQVKAVFNCLRDKPYELHYIPPPPIPVFTPGSKLSSGQRIRRLDEVVERRRGTCHDLAILFASCLEYIQVFPLIILITGHTFFGFWKNLEAHKGFWKRMEKNDLRRLNEGREWTITDLKEIHNLLNSEFIELVDAVTVTNRNAKFEDAVRAGIKYFNDTTIPNPIRRFDVAIDIQASRRTVQPL